MQYPFTDDLADIAYTANTGRSHFEHGLLFCAPQHAEMLSKLQSGDYLIGQAPSQPPPVAFIFTDKSSLDSLDLWESFGIIPDYVIGQGAGEYASLKKRSKRYARQGVNSL